MKSNKLGLNESKTTLDTLHQNQLQQMNENENDLEKLIEEKINLENMIKNTETPSSFVSEIEYEQIENKIKILSNEIEIRKNKNEYLDYFLDTGDILYSYYDIQEKIQEGTLPKKQITKKKLGAIFDVLEMAAKEDGNERCDSEEKPTVVKQDSTIVSRDRLLDDYMKKIHPDTIRAVKNIADDTYGECPSCEKEMFFSANEAVFTCVNCGYQEFVLIDSDKPSYKDPPREVSYYAYKRINHFNEWLAQFQAKESTEIPPEVFDMILLELKKERILDTKNIKQTKVREILKKLKQNKYYEHVPHIINRLNGQNAPIMNREVEEKLRYMFKEIQPSFVKHCPAGRNNFLSYSYVLYKFCELLELDEYLSCFPLLKNRDKLYIQDKIWELICNDLRWQYIKSI
jgi:RNA polymerase-binding transcription factor DksA